MCLMRILLTVAFVRALFWAQLWRPLVGILTAAVGAVAAFGRVEKGVNGRVELGHPVARHEERSQVEQVHKHLVAIAAGKEKAFD